MQRQQIRFIADVKACDIQSGETYRTADLSEGGLSIIGQVDWESGKPRELELSFRDQSLRVTAELIRSGSMGAGLRFFKLGRGERIRIRDFLSYVASHSKTTLSEKRRAPRLNVMQSVRWDHNRVEYETPLLDLSLLGAQIGTDAPPAIGDSITLYLNAANDSPAVSCKAVCVRHTKKGFSVEFDGITTSFRLSVSAIRNETLKPDS